ncbi:MAG: NADH-quinone oxidoreductase subunit L, partial [Armatimonadota bacterium]|nr:NADH-quinone oxidoreductase subunit L [Armatimonadota bacterium]
RAVVAIIACAAVAGSFVASVMAYLALARLPAAQQSHVSTLYTWISSGSFRADVSALVDPLSVFMVLVVSGVGFLIHVYSAGYMGHDPRFSRYFTFLNLFMFSMLLLVLASNFLLLFVGWELVGLCSYLLIGFWFERTSAANAGRKAFIVTRIGDLGFTLGIVLIFLTFGDLQYRSVFAAVNTVGIGTMTAITLLLFAGAVGKSAQIPLYVWLPDAMEGPTPVSALIHAATMVTAGVYLVGRCHPLFEAAPGVMTLVAVIGAVTAFFAATIALVHNDLKRVLAYSTISQIGYMFLGAGVGAFVAAMFHLMTHAFFKALLFLGAGSVMHAVDGETDLRKLGGLGAKMPITKWTFLIGALALAGVFPLSGFFSKDEILWAAYGGRQGGVWLYALGFATAGLTAFYVFRLVFKTFYGESGSPEVMEQAHESPPVMTVPLIVLAVLAASGGFLGAPESLRALGVGNRVEHFLSPVLAPSARMAHGAVELGPHAGNAQIVLMLATTALALAAIVAAHYLYVRRPGTATAMAQRLPGLYRLLANKYYVDEIYEALFVQPGKAMALALWKWIDVRVIDGGVNGAAAAVAYASRQLRLVQTGYVRNYALGILLGAVVLIAYLSVR